MPDGLVRAAHATILRTLERCKGIGARHGPATTHEVVDLAMSSKAHTAATMKPQGQNRLPSLAARRRHGRLMLSRPVPTERRSTAFLLSYALANADGAIAYAPLLTLLLPVKIERVAGTARLDLLAVIAVAGAVTASVANIGFGWLSDRSLLAGFGRRRWVAGGLVLTAASYCLLIGAASPAALVAAIALFQAAINAMLAPLTAMMADEIPDAQKGVAGGLLAFAGPVASALGAALVGVRMLSEAGRLAIIPAIVALLVLPLLLTRSRLVDGVATPSARRPPRRDLAVAWTARLLVQIAGVILSLYLFYYAESIVHGVAAVTLAGRVGRLVAITSAAALPVAVLLGRASDRVGRRKPFLLGSAALAAAGLAEMALVRDWQTAVIGFALYTIGAAVFLALHAGFAMQLLPDPRHRGRDLGLVNLTNTLPSIVGPPLAWSLATPRDFSPLPVVLAGVTAAGGAAMMGVRSRS